MSDLSQDLFAEEEDNVNSELFEQTEFSGVSGSGTSSSPGSQVVKQAPPPPQLPVLAPKHSVVAPATSKSYICAVCKKELKTLRGFKGHILRYGHEQPGSTAPQSTPADTDQGNRSAQAPEKSGSVARGAAQPTSSKVYVCPRCKSTLKTKGGFVNHQAGHKMKDALKQLPKPSEFKQNHLRDLMKKVILEIKGEPSGENTKTTFLSELMQMVEKDQSLDFVEELGDSISEIVLEKQAKILPANQYEGMQKKLNSYLNNSIDDLRAKLLQICEVEISSSLAGRLVFRIASKLLQETQKWVLQTMKPALTEEEELVLHQNMSEAEEKAFLVEIGGLLRSFYEKSLKQSSHQWQMLCQCIKGTFVDGQHPISRSQFLNKNNWFSGEEECIVPSDHASSFFKIIELKIMPGVANTSSSEEVIENILSNRELLDHWHHLTNAHLAEEVSLLFLRKIVGAYVKFSQRFEEQRFNRLEEKSVRASTTALRTHLQHNFVERVEEDEDLI